MEIQIRKCRPDEIADTALFYDRVVAWLDEHVNYPKWIYRVYPSERYVREMTETGCQYLCLYEERIAGAFVFNTDPQGNYRNGSWKKDLAEGSYLILHTLAVDPALQRKGAASEVIRFCLKTAADNGYPAVRADIVPGNFPSRHLFEKNGFSYAGDADLDRGLAEIPYFSLYEKNIGSC